MSQARFIHANYLLSLLQFIASMSCRRRQVRHGFLLSTFLLVSLWTMKDDVA